MKLLAALAIAAGLAGGASALPKADDFLRSAAAAHPDDPAVARAFAAELISRGAAAEALTVISEQIARDPARRPGFAQLLGRAQLATGDLAGARAALHEAIAHREHDAVAHLYLGLTELRLGDRASAERHLARAEELDPRLTERVRAASRQSASASPRGLARLSVAAGAGVEYDTNSTLEGDEDITALPGDRADSRLRYDAAFGVVLFRDERAEIATGYRIDESRHSDLETLDVQSHALFLGATTAVSPHAYARFEAGAALNRLDDRTHSHSASLASTLGWSLDRRGAFQLRTHAERRDHVDAPALPSLERDGWRFGGGLRHSLPTAFLAPGVFVTQLSYARTLTEGSHDPFGLGPAFDSHFGAVDASWLCALPASLRLDARLGLAAEHFDARNAVDFLSDDGVGDPNPDRRCDYAVDASVTLSRPLTRFLDLQLRARETRRFSNVDVYDWDRQVVGTQLRLRWPIR